MSDRNVDEVDRIAAIERAGNAIAGLHAPIQKPGKSDWLTDHREPGQSFPDYRDFAPVLPTSERTTLYVRAIGEMTRAHESAIAATIDLLGRFYGLPVKRLDPIDPAEIPPRARRRNPIEGHEQILSQFLLSKLAKEKPDDAVAVLALTTTDLWPGGNWNFVFGQASLFEGVGVWSLYRMGDPGVEPRLFLRRTLKTAVHETGHMFGILHCTKYDCGMNGANNQDEADGQPFWFCPDEEMKIWWGFKLDPIERYQSLAEFAKAHKLWQEAAFWRRSEEAIRAISIRS